jgi:hypothetical protein
MLNLCRWRQREAVHISLQRPLRRCVSQRLLSTECTLRMTLRTASHADLEIFESSAGTVSEGMNPKRIALIL